MTTLTEARRALLELEALNYGDGSLVDCVEERTRIIAAYLDSLVSLNIENPDILPVAVNPPVEANEIVRPASNFVQMSQHRHALRDLGARRFFPNPQERDAFAVHLQTKLNDEMGAIRELITSGALVESCGECFMCRNGGRGKGMEHPDPDPAKRCHRNMVRP